MLTGARRSMISEPDLDMISFDYSPDSLNGSFRISGVNLNCYFNTDRCLEGEQLQAEAFIVRKQL